MFAPTHSAQLTGQGGKYAELCKNIHTVRECVVLVGLA